ncbi:MAG: phosphonate C-P lyase system protein PhnG [Rubrivivax sp.]|nr:phosphonate C-P lyase system protein PhnG [Rubrivivax sp.]
MKPPHAEAPDTADARRAQWLRTLALADPALLALHADPVLADFRFEPLRASETGLALVRARVGGGGGRFNLGEATMTRCVVRHRAPDGQVVAGVGYALGRDARRVERIAQLDALLQRADLHGLLQRSVLQPLEQALAHARDQAAAATQASRVRFFTVQPEQTS